MYAKINLPQDTWAQYELVNEDQLYPQCTFGGWGEVDFTTLTIDHAEALVSTGFPYLKRKQQPKATAPQAATPRTSTVMED
jgi:hypothetical protein